MPRTFVAHGKKIFVSSKPKFGQIDVFLALVRTNDSWKFDCDMSVN